MEEKDEYVRVNAGNFFTLFCGLALIVVQINQVQLFHQYICARKSLL